MAVEDSRNISASELIRSARVECGFSSAAALARHLGVEPPTVRRWEADGRPPQSRYRAPLAAAIKVPLDVLVEAWGLGTASGKIYSLPTRAGAPEVETPVERMRSAEEENFIAGAIELMRSGGAATPEGVAFVAATAALCGIDWKPPKWTRRFRGNAAPPGGQAPREA